MSRLRKILKNTEHAPKQELWGNIESALDKIPFYKTTIFKISLSSVAIIGTALVAYLLMNNPRNNNIQLAKTDNHIIKEKAITTSVNANKAKPAESINTAVNQKPAAISNNVPLQSYYQPQSNTAFSVYNNKNVVPVNTVQNKQADNTNKQVAINNAQPIVKKDNANDVSPKQIIKEPKETSLNEPMQKVTPLYCSSIPDADKSNKQLIETSAPSSSSVTSKLKAASNLSLVLFAAPEISHSRYAGNSTSDINIDVKNRANADYIAFSQSYGAELKLDFNHWFIQSGINYSAIQSCSEYRTVPPPSDTLEYTLSNTTVIPAHDSAGHYIPPHYIYNWTSNKPTRSPGAVKKAISDLKVIQIPLLAGYSVSYHKLMFSISSGVSIGVPVSYTGEMIAIDNTGVCDISQLKPPLQKTTFDYLLRAGITYAYSMRYSIFIEPSYNYSLNSIFNKSYPLSQKFTTYGVRLGMLYKF
jgi:hypothetical protein